MLHRRRRMSISAAAASRACPSCPPLRSHGFHYLFSTIMTRPPRQYVPTPDPKPHVAPIASSPLPFLPFPNPARPHASHGTTPREALLRRRAQPARHIGLAGRPTFLDRCSYSYLHACAAEDEMRCGSACRKKGFAADAASSGVVPVRVGVHSRLLVCTPLRRAVRRCGAVCARCVPHVLYECARMSMRDECASALHAGRAVTEFAHHAAPARMAPHRTVSYRHATG